MAFEPVYSKPAFDCLKRLSSSQAVVEARLLPSGGSSISRVLSVSTDCTVTPSEVFAGEARYSGRVNFKVLFVDLEGKNHSIDYNADFTDKIMASAITKDVRPILSAHVLDTDIISVNEGEIKLACVAEVRLDAVMDEHIKCLTGGGESIYTHDDRLDYCRMVSGADENFTVTDTLDNVKAANILLAEARVLTLKRIAGDSSVMIEGNVINDLICETDDGSLFSYQLVTPFTQQLAATGARVDDVVCAQVALNSCQVKIEMDGEGKFGIAAEYSLTVCARVFTADTISPIVDAFSVTNELLIDGSSVKVCRNRCNETIAERVEGMVTLDETMPMADNILACSSPRLTISNVLPKDDKLTLEGMVTLSVIYFSVEANSKNSVSVELPFSITVNAPVSEGNIASACGVVTSVATKIRRGNEIDIKADISVEFNASSEDIKYVITELKLGEERALPTGAFAIHIAKSGENLWEVAKALSTTPEMVLVQNPQVTLPLSGGERLIAYRHLK